MKKTLILVLIILIFSLCGCGGENQPVEGALKSPPRMELWYGGEMIRISGSAALWEVEYQDGSVVSTHSQTLHPLQAERELIDTVIVDPAEAVEVTLRFHHRPKSLTVKRWDSECFGNMEAPAEQLEVKQIILNGEEEKEIFSYSLPVQEGSYLYEVGVSWAGGTANYIFCTETK